MRLLLIFVLLATSGCVRLSDIHVKSLFELKREQKNIIISGCLVHDPTALSGKHAFLSTKCDWGLGDGRDFPKELRSRSIDLVPMEDVQINFNLIPAGNVHVNGNYVPYVYDMNKDWVIPSGSLISSFGVIRVQSIVGLGEKGLRKSRNSQSKYSLERPE